MARRPRPSLDQSACVAQQRLLRREIARPVVGRLALLDAVVDDEATVKRYFVDGDGVRLEAENEDYDPIVVDPQVQAFRIAGKVVSLMRRF